MNIIKVSCDSFNHVILRPLWFWDIALFCIAAQRTGMVQRSKVFRFQTLQFIALFSNVSQMFIGANRNKHIRRRNGSMQKSPLICIAHAD